MNALRSRLRLFHLSLHMSVYHSHGKLLWDNKLPQRSRDDVAVVSLPFAENVVIWERSLIAVSDVIFGVDSPVQTVAVGK